MNGLAAADRWDRLALTDLDNVSDETLAHAARRGDADALLVLLERYRWMLRTLARRYFLPGGDVEDLIQEASIGFIKAVRDFKPDVGSSFRSFAQLCVQRQVITAVKSATREKHLPLNSALSLQQPRFGADGDSVELSHVLADLSTPSVEQCVTAAESFRELQHLASHVLSVYERKVIEGYLAGLSLQEIAGACGTHRKSVDNALWRVKCKLRRAIRQMREQALPGEPAL